MTTATATLIPSSMDHTGSIRRFRQTSSSDDPAIGQAAVRFRKVVPLRRGGLTSSLRARDRRTPGTTTKKGG
jgi:hypothetical protein